MFIINFDRDRSRALNLARELRTAGTRSARDLISRPLEDSLAHAREQGFRWAVVLRPGDPEGVTALDLATGTEEAMALAAVPDRVVKEV